MLTHHGFCTSAILKWISFVFGLLMHHFGPLEIVMAIFQQLISYLRKQQSCFSHAATFPNSVTQPEWKQNQPLQAFPILQNNLPSNHWCLSWSFDDCKKKTDNTLQSSKIKSFWQNTNCTPAMLTTKQWTFIQNWGRRFWLCSAKHAKASCWSVKTTSSTSSSRSLFSDLHSSRQHSGLLSAIL